MENANWRLMWHGIFLFLLGPFFGLGVAIVLASLLVLWGLRGKVSE